VGGRPGHRHGTRRSDSGHRVPVSRVQDDPDPETRARATAVAGTIRPTGRRWPRRCCCGRQRRAASVRHDHHDRLDQHRAGLPAGPAARPASPPWMSAVPPNNPIGGCLDEEGRRRRRRRARDGRDPKVPQRAGQRPGRPATKHRNQTSGQSRRPSRGQPAARVSRIDRTVMIRLYGRPVSSQWTIDPEAEPKAPQYRFSSGSSCDPGGCVIPSHRRPRPGVASAARRGC
jgi:hypothetical protein